MGVGPHAELLELTGPTFAEYAALHGYELHLLGNTPAQDRPPSWGKVVILQRLLSAYDEVLWVDADAVIVDCRRDISDDLHPQDLMGLAAHVTPEGDDPIPNAGVWFLRRDPAIVELLEGVWSAETFIDHKWWENAAVLTLLGYRLEPRVALDQPAPLWFRTRLLSNEWNSIAADPSPTPRIVHFPGMTHQERLTEISSVLERRAVSG